MSCDLKGFLTDFIKPLVFEKPVLTSLVLREFPERQLRAFQWAEGCRILSIPSNLKVSPFFQENPVVEKSTQGPSSKNQNLKPSLSDRFLQGALTLLWDFGQEVIGVIGRDPIRKSYRNNSEGL